MREDFHKWGTLYLQREFEMLVFGHKGFLVILFPTENGRYFINKDFGLINSASQFINEGKIKIYCPDGIDAESWYNYSIAPADRVKTHISYENVVLNDIIEFAKYESGMEKVGLAGCSFGGYHAVNLALKHPEHVRFVISMGGFFDIKRFIYGYYDDNCYFNNPPDYLPNMDDPWFLDEIRKIKFILGTGTNDYCMEENKWFSSILTKKNIEHILDIRHGTGHDWHWWREMFPYYLSLLLKD